MTVSCWHVRRLMAGLPQVHAKSTPSHRWLVVADAASYVPTHRLDLSTVQPDFVPISFYKLFGELPYACSACCSAMLLQRYDAR